MKEAIEKRRIGPFVFKFSKHTTTEVLSKKQVQEDLDELDEYLGKNDESTKINVTAAGSKRKKKGY